MLIAKRDPIDALPDQVCDRMLKQDKVAEQTDHQDCTDDNAERF
jgi:hypothetical protein